MQLNCSEKQGIDIEFFDASELYGAILFYHQWERMNKFLFCLFTDTNN